MINNRISLNKLTSLFPPDSFYDADYEKLIAEDLKKRLRDNSLDDDLAGVQTINSICLLTEWSPGSLEEIFNSEAQIYYILTNSRSMPAKQTLKTHKTIASNLCKIAKEKNKSFILIIRSDSTLRGHYPLETDTLKQTLKQKCDFNYTHEIIIPAFFEGGRFTFNDIHWVREDDFLIPCSETGFAHDKDFGYKNSNLVKWIMDENNKINETDTISISIEDIRHNGPEGVSGKNCWLIKIRR